MMTDNAKFRWKPRYTIYLIATAAMLWFGWHAWSEGRDATSTAGLNAKPVKQLPVVTVVRPVRKTASLSLSLPATVDAWYRTTLYAKVSGYAESINVDKGDFVRKGEVLAKLDVPEVDQEYQKAVAGVLEADAELKFAQSQATLQKLTYNRTAYVRHTTPNVLPQQALDVARAAYEKAEAQVSLAQAKMQAAQAEVGRLKTLRQFAEIKAPFSGVITARLVDPGALIRQGSSTIGTPLLSLEDMNVVRVYTYIPGADVRHVHRGEPAMVLLDSLPGKGFKGHVTRFADALNPQTRTMKAEIDLPNPAHRILPGMYGTVKLDLAPASEALMIPEPCIRHDTNGRSFVYVVQKGKVHKTFVHVGLNSGGMTQVKGLERDAVVVLSATASLQDGAAVKTIKGSA